MTKCYVGKKCIFPNRTCHSSYTNFCKQNKNNENFCPCVGPNGNWWINGVDTGKSSKGINGTNGKDGATPIIAPNGNWMIDNVDTGVHAQGEKGEKGDGGTIFYPSFASFYSSSEQNFEAKPLQYQLVKFQGVRLNAITLENETNIVFEHDGIYQITYTITALHAEDANVAIVSDDGSVKSNSVQALKETGTQTTMSFISHFTSDKKIGLGILANGVVSLENHKTNLVNASIDICEIPLKKE